MNSYIYTTHPCGDWIQEMRDEWIQSCKPFFCFWYLRSKSYRPHQFPKAGLPFWLYLYYSESRISGECSEHADLGKKMQFRIRVSEWTDTSDFNTEFPCPFIEQPNVHVIEPPDEPLYRVVTWFKCDRIEEIRKFPDQELLSLKDFKIDTRVSRNVGLALNASIPRAKRLSSIFILQTTACHIQD